MTHFKIGDVLELEGVVYCKLHLYLLIHGVSVGLVDTHTFLSE